MKLKWETETMTTTRDQIIETTCALLEAQGYHATGLNQILKESGAPKGSLYYYFPEGKEELTAEAIDRIGQFVYGRIKANLAQHDDPADAVREFMHVIAYHVEASEFRTGSPITTVALETAATSERLNLACRHAYAQIQAGFSEKLVTSGFSPERAAVLGEFIMSNIEGATILARVQHTGDPLRRTADMVALFLRGSERA
jgi:TetR/AcrR family transcriptional repressor of lmrAB and yxaGH operons